jgi:hypothetical protein
MSSFWGVRFLMISIDTVRPKKSSDYFELINCLKIFILIFILIFDLILRIHIEEKMGKAVLK